jgi:hypothetical protein
MAGDAEDKIVLFLVVAVASGLRTVRADRKWAFHKERGWREQRDGSS